MAKILAEAANVLGEALIQVKMEHRRDGYVDPQEEFVEEEMRYVLGLVEQVIGREKLKQRIGNGMITRALIIEITEYDDQLRDLKEKHQGRTWCFSSEDAAA